MAKATWTDPSERSFLDTVDAVGALLAGALIKPYTAGPISKANAVPADYTLATFAGSAPVPVALGPVHNSGDGAAEKTQFVEYVATAAPAAEETVTGLLVTNAAGTVVLMDQVLPEPATVAGAGDAVSDVLRVQLRT